MANKKLGYVPLYRSIQDNWIWKFREPFDHRSAWVDLLLLVNHKEEKIPVGTRIQTIKPGQRWLSYQWLGTRWGWSRRKVLRFIAQLVSDGMVQVDGTTNGTLLTIVNWGFFNGSGTTDGTTNDTTNDTTDGITPITTDGTTDGIQTINKEKENDKEGKKIRTPAPPNDGGEWQ
jgi:DNA replication protein DnaD